MAIRVVVIGIRVGLFVVSTGPVLVVDDYFLPLELRTVSSCDPVIPVPLDDFALSVLMLSLPFPLPCELSASFFWGRVRRNWKLRTPERRDKDV